MELGERDNMKKRCQLLLALCVFSLINSAPAEIHRLKFHQYEDTGTGQFKFTVFDLDGTKGRKTLELKLGDNIAGWRVEAFRNIVRYHLLHNVDEPNPIKEHEIILVDPKTEKQIALVYGKVILFIFPDQNIEPTH